jgi:hypothetical protein
MIEGMIRPIRIVLVPSLALDDCENIGHGAGFACGSFVEVCEALKLFIVKLA